MKVRNLKANHNASLRAFLLRSAVLASVKVRNLKANHNVIEIEPLQAVGCISKCEGTESES